MSQHSDAKVFPRCRTGQSRPFVSAQGEVTPCCWIANAPTITELRKFLGEDIDSISLKHHSLAEIFRGKGWQKLQASWQSDAPFHPCTLYCGRPFTSPIKNTRNRQNRFELSRDNASE